MTTPEDEAFEARLAEDAFREQCRFATCAICHINTVDAANGYDTCDDCLENV